MKPGNRNHQAGPFGCILDQANANRLISFRRHGSRSLTQGLDARSTAYETGEQPILRYVSASMCVSAILSACSTTAVTPSVSSRRGSSFVQPKAALQWKRPKQKAPGAPRTTELFYYWPCFGSLVIASAALPATTQFADPATTASSSNQRSPKSSMHSGKSGLITMYPGITAPGM